MLREEVLKQEAAEALRHRLEGEGKGEGGALGECDAKAGGGREDLLVAEAGDGGEGEGRGLLQ